MDDAKIIEALKNAGYSERLRYGNELAARFKRSNDPKIIEQLERFYKEELIAEVLDFPPEIMARKKIWDNLFLDAQREVFKRLVEEDSPLVMRAKLLKVADDQTTLGILKRHYDEFDFDQRIDIIRRLIGSKETGQLTLDFLRPKFDSIEDFMEYISHCLDCDNEYHWAHYIINSEERFPIGTIEKFFYAASEEDKFIALQKYYDELTPRERLQCVLACGQSSVTPALFDFLLEHKFFDGLTDSQLQMFTMHFIQTSAKDKTLKLLRSKFDSARFVDFMNKCLNNIGASDELRASIIFNAPEDFSVELIMKFWSKAEQSDRANFFKRRGEELIEHHLQFLLEAMAKGELPLSVIDALEKRFGATELAEKVIRSVNKRFFSYKMMNYILGLKKELPIELILPLVSHTPLKGKYAMLARYARIIPRDRLIALANELVRDDYTQSARVVGEIFRSMFDEKDFIEIVTECAAWSIEHDADKISTVLSMMPLFEMHFRAMPMERHISPPRKWANFIFNAPERFPIDIIVKLSPYAWMHDQMTAMEKYFYDLPIEQRLALGYALVDTPLDNEELPNFTTGNMPEIMELNWRFEQRQQRLREMLEEEDTAPDELSKEISDKNEWILELERNFDELDRAQLIERANALIETEFADRTMQILRSKMSSDALADFIWDCKEQNAAIKPHWAKMVLKTPNEFPEFLIRSLKPFAPAPKLERLADGDLFDVEGFRERINKEYRDLKSRGVDSEPKD